MKDIYDENAMVFKALSDPNRIKIVEMLSYGEICACTILEKLNITQPTLSHHMKRLEESKLVYVRKDNNHLINQKPKKLRIKISICQKRWVMVLLQFK